MRSKGPTFFSESSHVAYQANGNEEQNIVHAHILSLHTIIDP